LLDTLAYALKALHDILIREPDYSEPKRFERGSSGLIVCFSACREMRVAIDFDDKADA